MLQIYPRLIKSEDATGERWELYELDLPTDNACLTLQYKLNKLTARITYAMEQAKNVRDVVQSY